MNKLHEIITSFTPKVSRYSTILLANMRLVLLAGFGILCGYLALQVNSLVSEQSSQDAASASITSKKPDADVMSVFNELQSQNIEVNSQFDLQRNNPF